MRALVLNDTGKGQHPGCMLVMGQLLEGCRISGIQVSRTLSLGRGFKKVLQDEISSCDVVVINGEGTMHHDTPGALALADAGMFARDHGKPVAIINTVWEGNRQANQLLPCASLIYARESFSAAEIRRVGATATVVPDLALSCPADQLFPMQEQGHGPVVVLDDVRFDMAVLLARYARSRGLQFLRMAPRPPLHSFSTVMKWGQLCVEGGGGQFRLGRVGIIKEASIVVTGRFHGSCLAILARRPFVAVSSNTHKIQGLLADAHLGDGAALVPDATLSRNPFEQIDAAIQQVRQATNNPCAMRRYQEACQSYSEKAKMDATLMFKAIAALGQKVA